MNNAHVLRVESVTGLVNDIVNHQENTIKDLNAGAMIQSICKMCREKKCSLRVNGVSVFLDKKNYRNNGDDQPKITMSMYENLLRNMKKSSCLRGVCVRLLSTSNYCTSIGIKWRFYKAFRWTYDLRILLIPICKDSFLRLELHFNFSVDWIQIHLFILYIGWFFCQSIDLFEIFFRKIQVMLLKIKMLYDS